MKRRLVIAGLALAGQLAWAHGVFPRYVPIDRLITNTKAHIAANPNDAGGYYRLGRIHTMALQTKSGFVLAWDDRRGEAPAEGSWANRPFHEKPNEPNPPTNDKLKEHLAAAITNLNRAIEFNPNEPRYRLTLACALEAGETLRGDVEAWALKPPAGIGEPEDWIKERCRKALETLADHYETAQLVLKELGADKDPKVRAYVVTLAQELGAKAELKGAMNQVRKADWSNQIEEQYFVAMCHALPADGTAAEKPIWGGMEDWVAYEAAKNFVRLVKARTIRPSDTIRLKVAEATIKAFDSLPRPSAITPLVISFEHKPLRDLIDCTPVAFDLDGSGRAQHWPWPKIGTGILVWDPQHTGTITSGRQLFGSVSWWVFFRDGYQALDALDNDRDGSLSGAELDGIGVWFDSNSNGASERGEVVTAASLGITELSCRATATHDGCPSNPIGARLSDGRTVPTIDWIARPIKVPDIPYMAQHIDTSNR